METDASCRQIAQLKGQHSAQPASSPEDAKLIADSTLAWLELPTEGEIYTSLASALQQVVGDDVIISISRLEEQTRAFKPQVILGLGALLEKVASLLGKHPIDLDGDFPVAVKAAMAEGRLIRVEGGVTELAGDGIPPVVAQQAVRLLGLQDAYVVGFIKGHFAGGICLMTRRRDQVLRSSTIEALARITAVITERKRAEQANADKMDELRRWHEVTLGRESRILELKLEVNELLVKSGQLVRYASVDGDKPNE